MGARTDAARAEVVARRQLLAEEIVKLEAAGRAAVDVKAKIRRAPAKTAALATSIAFLALGGPKRTFRAIRRAVLGPKADLPKSMLPKEIDKALRSLGDDGGRVRGAIERSFAGYLEETKDKRQARDLPGTIAELGGNILRPVTAIAGKRLAQGLFSPEPGSFAESLKRIRARREANQAEEGEPPPAPRLDATAPKPSRWVRRPAGRNVLRPN